MSLKMNYELSRKTRLFNKLRPVKPYVEPWTNVAGENGKNVANIAILQRIRQNTD